MFNALDRNEVVHSDDLAESAIYVGRRFDEKIDDAIRLDEARQSLLDSSSPDFWKPVDEWMLD